MLKRLILMVQFFTRIPIKTEIVCSDEDFGKGLVFAPIIGLLIGEILLGSFFLMDLIFPRTISIVLIIIIYITITGGLHLDGLADTFDGIFSGRSKDRILEIMKDSRLGTFGLLAVISVVLLNVFTLIEIPQSIIYRSILLFPVAGRIGSYVGASISKYAREDGLGKSFINYCNTKELFIGMVISFIIFYIFAGLIGLAICIVIHIVSIILTKGLSKKIGGATGDILGCVCELNQTIFLLIVFLAL